MPPEFTLEIKGAGGNIVHSSAFTVDGPVVEPPVEPEPGGDKPSAAEMAVALGKGCNAGEYLESAGSPASWGGSYGRDDAKRLADLGFSHVRIPCRWDLYADGSGKVQDRFTDLVDKAVEETLAEGMIAIINQHHYESLNSGAAAQKFKFVALWKTIADRYKNAPNSKLVFELGNEIKKPMGEPGPLMALYRQAMAEIRKTNPHRIVAYGPQYNSGDDLSKMATLDDPLTIGTFHWYGGVGFTLQGMAWAGKGGQTGVEWPGGSDQRGKPEFIEKIFADNEAWSNRTGLPVWLGEMGVSRAAPAASADRWIRFVAGLAERYGFPRTYWSWNGPRRSDTAPGFGLFQGGVANKALVDAFMLR